MSFKVEEEPVLSGNCSLWKRRTPLCHPERSRRICSSALPNSNVNGSNALPANELSSRPERSVVEGPAVKAISAPNAVLVTLPPIGRPATNPNFLHPPLDAAARAPFIKERRMKFARATNFYRKSGKGRPELSPGRSPGWDNGAKSSPAGTAENSPLGSVLGYSQPSLRDCALDW